MTDAPDLAELLATVLDLADIEDAARKLKVAPVQLAAWCRGEWAPGELLTSWLAKNAGLAEDAVRDACRESARRRGCEAARP